MNRSIDGSKFIDVEVSLDRKYFGAAVPTKEIEYEIELRGSLPDEAEDMRRIGSSSFDHEQLEALIHNPQEYGLALSQSLFPEEIKNALGELRAIASRENLPIRLRLLIKPEAAELHQLHWEALRSPQDEKSLLTTDENLPFSRYLLRKKYHSINRRARHDLKALVVIANPDDLQENNLAPVDVDGELGRAQKALENATLDVLPQPDAGRWATLENIFEMLRQNDYDLLYLVCHGTLAKSEPYLWLEDNQRKVARQSGADLIDRLQELRQIPRLVVLASCESASAGSDGALTALGPRLVEEGVPAVVAMQGKVSMETIEEFMPAFFKTLNRTGEIDRAMTVARGTVRERHDFWMPVLFMRLKDGSIWYEPGFRGEGGERVKFSGWPGLIASIQDGKCTPIIGPGLYEWLLGSQRDIARRWAEEYDYPMAPYERESIVHVAQYLAATQKRYFVLSALRRHIKKEIMRFHKDDLDKEFLKSNPSLNKMIERVGAGRRKRDPNELYSVLARMPFPIYLSANPGLLLEDALREVDDQWGDKKDPQLLLCPWNKYTQEAYKNSVFSKEPDYTPSESRPLVMHLFGQLEDDPDSSQGDLIEGDSLVITEDDHFDFLLGINKWLLPRSVKSALVNTSLLFLGFQMDDWDFRTLLRYILSIEGGELRKRHIHVAVQVNPEEGDFLKPSMAYEYLRTYFTSEANIEIYWGSTEDFILELQEQYQQRAA
ncbi:MAG: CHAT domain-containing protein [Anaerolineales bacterium]